MVQLKPSHAWHVDVGDQAGRAIKVCRAQEVFARRESVYGKSKRSHEASSGLANVLVVVDNGNQALLSYHCFAL
jgi:hypothetical protein